MLIVGCSGECDYSNDYGAKKKPHTHYVVHMQSISSSYVPLEEEAMNLIATHLGYKIINPKK